MYALDIKEDRYDGGYCDCSEPPGKLCYGCGDEAKKCPHLNLCLHDDFASILPTKIGKYETKRCRICNLKFLIFEVEDSPITMPVLDFIRAHNRKVT